MIKANLKKSQLWKRIINSDLYQRIKFPVKFEKQQKELNFYRKFLKSHPSKNRLIFDVGANRGNKSFIFSKLAKKVVAFEPSAKLFLFLKKRFKNSNVIIYDCALGSKISLSSFYIVENNEAYNSLNRKHIDTTAASRNIATFDTVKTEKIKVEIIENFITKHGVPKYIKIDVEGYEQEVIKGLTTPVPLLSFEVNLPEFCRESIEVITYLDALSNKKYKYNVSTNNSFLLKKFIEKDEIIGYLGTTNLSYLEVFVKLDSAY